MRVLRTNIFSYLLVVTLAVSSLFFYTSCSQHGQTGAAVGAGVGAAAGALIDKDNRWRGAVIGGTLGGIFGGTLGEISDRAAREAAREGKPVVYESEDGYRRVEATPQGYNEKTDCHKVRERVWEDGVLVKDETREVCESDMSKPEY